MERSDALAATRDSFKGASSLKPLAGPKERWTVPLLYLPNPVSFLASAGINPKNILDSKTGETD